MKPLTKGYKKHRRIIERVLGRKLKENEVVHHKNGNIRDKEKIKNPNLIYPFQRLLIP